MCGKIKEVRKNSTHIHTKQQTGTERKRKKERIENGAKIKYAGWQKL